MRHTPNDDFFTVIHIFMQGFVFYVSESKKILISCDFSAFVNIVIRKLGNICSIYSSGHTTPFNL